MIIMCIVSLDYLTLGMPMKILLLASAVLLVSSTRLLANEFPRISQVNSSTPTEALLAKPGTYIGEKFTFEDKHSGDVLVRVGVWDVLERMKKQIVRIGAAKLLMGGQTAD